MAININDLILKVTSRISDRVDGDTVLLIEQNIPTSIYRVTKTLAQVKPKGHELLLKEQDLADSTLENADLNGYTNYKRFKLTSLNNQIVTDDSFHALNLKSTTGAARHRAFPMKTMAAIGLSTVHNKICYYVEYPYVYLSYPASGFTQGTGTDTIKLTHYAYLPPSEFPSELEDYLIDDLLQLLQGEAQKQAAEMSMPNL